MAVHVIVVCVTLNLVYMFLAAATYFSTDKVSNFCQEVKPYLWGNAAFCVFANQFPLIDTKLVLLRVVVQS